ncbi:MAG: endonuclease/exonuclease/phosphatase family protein, partial [Limisphaerales bacterium]
NVVFLSIILFLHITWTSAATLKVMTYNLRYASTNKPNAWPDRRPIMKDCLTKADPDIIGTQEGVYYQINELERDLPQYRWIGTGRDGGSRGEFMAIFYKHERFEPLEYDHFWLSDTPEVIGSTTWGNTNRRMVTWVRFKDRTTGVEFYLVNTHFDHQIQPAREKAAALLLDRAKKLKADLPLIVMGDFNAKAGANKAFEILTADNWLTDTWNTAREKRGQVVATFNNFRDAIPGDNRIDWILTRNVDAPAWIEINTCEKDGQFPSDHFPVTVEIRWERKSN